MKKILIVITLVMVIVSCSQSELYRTVNIEIPQHPWEEVSSKGLWYTLKITNGDKITSLHVNNSTRTLSVKIPLGETVYICAFPLGDMEPFGIGITPLDNKSLYLLTQNQGRLSRIFMDQEPDIRKNINFSSVEIICSSLTEDFRNINEVELIYNTVNGNLKKSSIKLNKLTDIPELSVPEGTWISENLLDNSIQALNGKFPSLKLPPGVHRYYCAEQKREIRISVNYDGTIQAVLKQSLVP